MFGVGPGALVGDAFRMGIDPANQRRMMNESLDVLIRLLDGETVTKKTDWFDLHDAHLQIGPYQTPRTEMAVACARSPSGALAAGRHGLGMLSIGGTNDEALAKHADNWRMCEEAAAENGHTVKRENWRLVTLMHIAETRQEARDNVEFGLENWAKYFREIATFPIVPAGIDNPYEFLTENKMAVIGTPDDAIEYIETLLDGAGGFGALMQLAHNWADFDATKRNYELISRYVFPHFQGSNKQRDFSYDGRLFYRRCRCRLFACRHDKGRAGRRAADDIDRHIEPGAWLARCGAAADCTVAGGKYLAGDARWRIASIAAPVLAAQRHGLCRCLAGNHDPVPH
jgi:limonene 1,2-monooxygenase